MLCKDNVLCSGLHPPRCTRNGGSNHHDKHYSWSYSCSCSNWSFQPCSNGSSQHYSYSQPCSNWSSQHYSNSYSHSHDNNHYNYNHGKHYNDDQHDNNQDHNYNHHSL